MNRRRTFAWPLAGFFASAFGDRWIASAALLALFALAGCGAQGVSTQRELTQRERDSTLGQSVIPGAFTVTRALKESDRAGDVARAMDAQVDSQAP